MIWIADIDSFSGDYHFLSNFWVASGAYIQAFGCFVRTTEHGFQAAKCARQKDRYAILTAETPGKAKRMGQNIEIRDDWDEVKEHVMYTLLRRKFAHQGAMAELLHTGTGCLVEGNTWGDRYWGCTKNPVGRWEGSNRLGVLLMQVRGELLILRGL